MATGSLSQNEISASSEAGQIAGVLQTNCRHWKLLDLLLIFSQTTFIGLLILCSALAIDHWAYLIIQDGSLGSLGRWLYFLVLFVTYPTVSIYLICRSLKGRINPLFVAQQIEELSPEIKNSISNFWQIQSAENVHPSIVESMAQRACIDLDDDRAEDGVDTTKTSLWGYSSLGCLAITAIYFAIMPNPSLQTMHRILIPWDSVQRPSEIIIESVQPGDATITYGSTFKITAKLSGTDDHTPVFLVTESTDGTTGRRRLPMQLDDSHYEILLNESPFGIQQDFSYWIEAGNPNGRTAISEQFHVIVKPAAAIGITQVEYVFPGYTDLPNAVNSRQFNIEAIEGTTVKISALANKPIDSAWLKLRSTSGSTEQRNMTIMGDQTCKAEFELRVDANQSPAYVSYQIFFRTRDGKTNPEAIEYSINTLTDLPPVIEFTKPARRELQRGPMELAANQSIQLTWSAHDPDYQLSSVAMVASQQNQDDIRIELLTPNHRKDTENTYTTTFTPKKHKLSPGTRVTIYGEAADNRKTSSNPQPNRTQSELLVIHIIDPVKSTEDDPSDEMSDDSEMSDSPSENMEDKNAGSDNDDGMSSEGKEGESGEAMAEGASEDSEEGGDPGIENKGTGGKGKAADDPDNGTDENTPDSQGGEPENSSSENSDDGESDNDNTKTADGMESKNDGDGSTSENNSNANQSEDNTGQQKGENETDSPQSNNDSANGNPTGETGDDNTGKQPDKESSSKPDDQHDGDIFEKLLDRLRAEQEGKQQDDNQSFKQEPMEGETNAAKQEESQKNSGNKDENQPSAEEGDEQANAQNGVENPQTNDPANPQQQNSINDADADAESTATKDPMKNPRDGNTGGKGEQVTEEGGGESTGQAEGPQTGDSETKDNPEANGQNRTNTPGSQDDMNTSASGESNAGTQANQQSGTGQKDASPTDELGLPEQVEDTEQARLDYTRKATDLALKYLRDHQDNPSDELLEDLGITAEQLREMVARYEQLKKDSTQTGKQTLNETLRSLGLQPSADTKARRVKTNNKEVRGVSGGGALSGLPPHLQQRFKSFRKGTTVSDE